MLLLAVNFSPQSLSNHHHHCLNNMNIIKTRRPCRSSISFLASLFFLCLQYNKINKLRSQFKAVSSAAAATLKISVCAGVVRVRVRVLRCWNQGYLIYTQKEMKIPHRVQPAAVEVIKRKREEHCPKKASPCWRSGNLTIAYGWLWMPTNF